MQMLERVTGCLKVCWIYPGDQERRGIVEVTSPPDEQLMATWARAKRSGDAQSESGSIPVRWNELAQVCAELLEQDWARENVDKPLAQPADEGTCSCLPVVTRVGDYFYRLSDSYEDSATEEVSSLVLPLGLTDVWFRGRAVRELGSHTTKLWLARFQDGTGWHRYVTHIEEHDLPAPNLSIADDRVPANRRHPKDRGLWPRRSPTPRGTHAVASLLCGDAPA
jgi:hypothetical protein